MSDICHPNQFIMEFSIIQSKIRIIRGHKVLFQVFEELVKQKRELDKPYNPIGFISNK